MIRRTVVVKLAVLQERRDDLRETTERGNRPKQERFCCRKCDYEVQADYNAVVG
ncbi:hypothetical protein HAPAU_35920 [Halalkalicoccus paucihalophilus]|uniref:Transposase DNA-binding domain protein n=1 Tax=Halalkalicoccus paucihalophilus TaxID=1008153 RepID=A0A151AAG1_9EURY|nr:hypothetical protein [Halalkalicoccus paucihalophilus]KYH24609.1 hypothetical protein HAPAU_35920 [Halalkalicoccus paucihalophilus]